MYYDIEITEHITKVGDNGKMLYERTTKNCDTLPDWAIQGLLESINHKLVPNSMGLYFLNEDGDSFSTIIKEMEDGKFLQYYVEYKIATKEDPDEN